MSALGHEAWRLATAVDRFRRMQAPDGTVTAGAGAEESLRAIGDGFAAVAGDIGRGAVGAAAGADIERWIAAGLDTPPCFDATRDALRPPAPGEPVTVLAPVIATNGPAPRGHFLEFFVARRDEPAVCARAAMRFPHPLDKCQSLRLRAASAGFATGNCIVFFPENVAGATPIGAQAYAMFFFNKFRRIYADHTMPAVRALLGDEDGLFGRGGWSSAALDAESCYAARCLWGYLHDYFHHHGPRLLDRHLAIKLGWFTGLLEEIKCDARAVLAALDAALPFAEEIAQFVLFERMLRYPAQPDRLTNFDAGTGVLLFERLAERGALRFDGAGGRLSLDAVLAALDDLVAEIEDAERLDDDAYRAAARALVRRYLPPGAPGDRFALPQRYRWTIGEPRDLPPIHFGPEGLT